MCNGSVCSIPKYDQSSCNIIHPTTQKQSLFMPLPYLVTSLLAPMFCRVQFEDVHRLSDGQVKHSSEVFYAGSLWKVCVYKHLSFTMSWLRSTML